MTIWFGNASIDGAEVRDAYNREVGVLYGSEPGGVNDKGRDVLARKYGQQTPTPYRQALPDRPGDKSGGAGKTNPRWNKIGKNARPLGKCLIILAGLDAGRQIAQSDDPMGEAAESAGAMPGALLLGQAGAERGVQWRACLLVVQPERWSEVFWEESEARLLGASWAGRLVEPHITGGGYVVPEVHILADTLRINLTFPNGDVALSSEDILQVEGEYTVFLFDYWWVHVYLRNGDCYSFANEPEFFPQNYQALQSGLEGCRPEETLFSLRDEGSHCILWPANKDSTHDLMPVRKELSILSKAWNGLKRFVETEKS
jgi:hypothetical protein